MNGYRISIDTSKPSRQVIEVPTDTPRYGLAVTATNGRHEIRNLSVSVIDGAETIPATRTLDDGTQIVELSSGAVEHDRAIQVWLKADPIVTGEGVGGLRPYDIATGTIKMYTVKKETSAYTDLGVVTWMPNGSANYRRKDNTFYGVGEKVDVSDTLSVGQNYTYKEGGRTKTGWRNLATIPAGSYYLDEMDGIFSGYVGNAINSRYDVVLNETKTAHADMEIPETDYTIEQLTLSGETHAPVWQTITIGGVSYTFLVAEGSETPAETEPEDDPETDAQ